MQFHKQKSAHIPQIGIFGDCYRTALACVLDMDPETVPHFMQLFQGQSDAILDQAIDEWLRQRGFTKIDIPYFANGLSRGEIMNIIAQQNGYDLLYLLTGMSSNNSAHVVICRGNQVLWDPSDCGINEPIQGYYIVTHILPSSMRLTDSELRYLLEKQNG